MSRLDDLPPDQKAALALLLSRRQSYAELASVLGISERSVHDRAHAGLAMLAPAQARALSPQEREQIGDYLLGQAQGDDARAGALLVLESSPDARAWAQALASELAPIGDGALPRVSSPESAATPARSTAPREAAAAPAPAAPAAGATPARAPSTPPVPPEGSPARTRASARPTLPVSRTAGAILLAVLVAGVVLAAVLIPSGGGSSKTSGASGKEAASRGEGGATKGGTSPQAKRIAMHPVEPGSKSKGVTLVLTEGGKYAFYLAAEQMPPSHGFFYAVWLYNSPTSAEALGKSPPVGADGRLQGGALLPADAANYHSMVVTRETNEHPRHPGPIVLSGAFALH